MKIAIISTIRDRWGGSEELWAAFAEEALKNGHEIIISQFDCGELSGKTQLLVAKGAKIDFRIGTIQKNLPPWKYLIKRVKRIYEKLIGSSFAKLSTYSPDIILYVGTAYSIAEDHKLLRLIDQNLSSFFINVQLNFEAADITLTAIEKETILKAYGLAKKIFFVSERNKQVAETHLGCKIGNGIIVRNPVNIPSTEPITFPKREPVQFCLIGNLTVIHKGQDIVLEILTKPTWRNEEWHLNIYGNGKDYQYLRKLVDSHQLNEKITFHGTTDDIRKVWQNNHILLMPSHMEGMPLAVVEAMLCGRAVIATDVGGISEWVEEGKSGFIADTATAAAFSKALEKAWKHKDQWEMMGKNAHERAKDLHDEVAGKTLFNTINAAMK